MKEAKVMIVITILALSWSSVNAQGNNRSPSVHENEIRSQHFNSAALPDGLAFESSARGLVAMAERDPEFMSSWIHENWGLNDTESLELLALLKVTLGEINSEREKKFEETACITGVPRVYGDNTYKALEQMDDDSEVISEKHYLRFKNQIDGDTKEHFQEWLDSEKLNIVYTKLDHKERSRRTRVDGYRRLEKICSSFSKNSSAGD